MTKEPLEEGRASNPAAGGTPTDERPGRTPDLKTAGREAFTRFRVSENLFTPGGYHLVMPRIEVSENLYRQLEDEANGETIDSTLWKMVGTYRRKHNPEADRK